MALNVWDPFTALARLDTEFDDLMRRAWGPRPATTAGYVPPIEMAVDGTDVLITVELPGVDVERDVHIEVAEGRLTIQGERSETTVRHHAAADTAEKDQATDEHGQAPVLLRELRYGAFRREFALPEGVTAEQVEASYDRGLLTIRVKDVTRPVRPPARIQVRTESTPKSIEAPNA